MSKVWAPVFFLILLTTCEASPPEMPPPIAHQMGDAIHVGNGADDVEPPDDAWATGDAWALVDAGVWVDAGPELDRQWGQIYYANNPSEGEQICIEDRR